NRFLTSGFPEAPIFIFRIAVSLLAAAVPVLVPSASYAPTVPIAPSVPIVPTAPSDLQPVSTSERKRTVAPPARGLLILIAFHPSSVLFLLVRSPPSSKNFSILTY